MTMRALRWLLLTVALVVSGPANAAFELATGACETTTTTGTSTVNLAGAYTAGGVTYVTIASQVASGNTVPYTLHSSDGKFEHGIGVFTDATPDTMTRVAYWSSDGSGAELTLPAGTHILCVQYGEEFVLDGVLTPYFAGLEIGHATQNTINCASGECSIEGDKFKQAGKQTLWIPGGSIVPRTTAGCTVADRETNSITIRTCNYADGADSAGQFTVAMPKNWDEGTITFFPYWTAASGSGTVDWELNCGAFSDDDALTSATLGTPQASNDTLIAANDVHIGPESSAITVGGTPAEADMLVCQVLRDISDDTLAVAAELLGAKVIYTDNDANDD